MKTPLLIDVPQARPAKRSIQRAQLKAFKAKLGLWTYHTPGMERKDEPWTVMMLAEVREQFPQYKETGPVEIIADYGARLEEMGLMVFGETERMAIEALCRQNDIPCEL